MTAWRKLRALGASDDALRVVLRCADEREAWSKLPLSTQAQLAHVEGEALVRLAIRATGPAGELLAAHVARDRATVERYALNPDGRELVSWAAHASLAWLDGEHADAEAAARVALRVMHPPVSSSVRVPCPFDAASRPSLPTLTRVQVGELLGSLFLRDVESFAIVAPDETDAPSARGVLSLLHPALVTAWARGVMRIDVTIGRAMFSAHVRTRPELGLSGSQAAGLHDRFDIEIGEMLASLPELRA